MITIIPASEARKNLPDRQDLMDKFRKSINNAITHAKQDGNYSSGIYWPEWISNDEKEIIKMELSKAGYTITNQIDRILSWNWK